MKETSRYSALKYCDVMRCDATTDLDQRFKNRYNFPPSMRGSTRDIWVFSVIKITLICLVRMPLAATDWGLSVKLNMCENIASSRFEMIVDGHVTVCK